MVLRLRLEETTCVGFVHWVGGDCGQTHVAIYSILYDERAAVFVSSGDLKASALVYYSKNPHKGVLASDPVTVRHEEQRMNHIISLSP